MNILIRADASLEIGTGHVMRCLTLADGLSRQGDNIQFICREHDGHMIAHIESKGYPVHSLKATNVFDPEGQGSRRGTRKTLFHAPWLGVSQEKDAQDCKPILRRFQPDWLIVDHYAIDKCWENELRGEYDKLMIVDDLADRPHECNLLLDQNLGRTMDDYADLVPENCIVLIGPHFALLRSEFAAMREYSLERRASSRIKRLLISMGGVDMSNTTSEILETLKDCPLRDECGITVVMGSQSPWRDNVSAIAASMHWRVEVLTGIDEMARVMADSDLAIGAAGSTSWERCCLGLPTLLVVLSENQWDGARALAKAGAAILVGEKSTVREQLSQALTRITSDGVLVDVSLNASAITDGRGVMRVVEKINFSNE